MTPVQRLTWLALAGAVGTLARYALAGAVQRAYDATFPWGTLVVNGLGCFLFGLVWTLAQERFLISAEMRLVLLVGFMGAFTTFSTYAFETSAMLGDGEWLRAAANALAENGLGVSLFLLGTACGRTM